MSLEVYNERLSFVNVGWKAIAFVVVFLLPLTAYVRPAGSEEPVVPGKGQGLSSYLQSIASTDPVIQEDGLKALNEMVDPSAFPLLDALNDGSLYIWKNASGGAKVVILKKVQDQTGQEKILLLYPLTGETLNKETDQEVDIDNDLDMVSVKTDIGRRLLRSALERLKLFDRSAQTRTSAATKIGNSGDLSALPILEQALTKETDRWAKHAMEEAINQIRLAYPDPVIRRQAALNLGDIKGLESLPRLKSLLSKDGEPDESVRNAIQSSVQRIVSYQQIAGFIGTAFSGLSLGSILLLMGLGLAIIFGLMGVINMAHGEMMMIGAYTAFVLQGLFTQYISPANHDFYFIAALPASFIVTGLVGLALEKSVIRFLYGRPLETLLATWGISLILQQAARWYFGDLTSVNAPNWMRGGVQAMVGLVLPFNRIFIIILSAVGLFAVYLLLFRTRWGLRIRAVTQNRDMSACLGVSTRKVDSWTFAFGAGLAGLAGCALSLIGNVDPEVGSTYIVDSFMVVVVGGVGKLAGVVVSALGIGMLNKILEPLIGGTGGAIYAKLFILAAIILFLQRKPSGLFPAKGRAAETQ
jgi:urea transport system permease protein